MEDAVLVALLLLAGRMVRELLEGNLTQTVQDRRGEKTAGKIQTVFSLLREIRYVDHS